MTENNFIKTTHERVLFEQFRELSVYGINQLINLRSNLRILYPDLTPKEIHMMSYQKNHNLAWDVMASTSNAVCLKTLAIQALISRLIKDMRNTVPLNLRRFAPIEKRYLLNNDRLMRYKYVNKI